MEEERKTPPRIIEDEPVDRMETCRTQLEVTDDDENDTDLNPQHTSLQKILRIDVIDTGVGISQEE